MNWILEQPLPVLIIGLLMEAMLFAALYNTGRRGFIWAMAGVALLTAAVLAVGFLVVTPFEEVRDTLYLLARAIEKDDRATVLAHIYSKSPELRQEAEHEMKNYRVTTVSVKRNLTVEFNKRLNPPEATARFNVVCEGSTQAGVSITGNFAALMEVKFRKEDGVWRVSEYKDYSPVEGLREKRK